MENCYAQVFQFIRTVLEVRVTNSIMLNYLFYCLKMPLYAIVVDVYKRQVIRSVPLESFIKLFKKHITQRYVSTFGF